MSQQPDDIFTSLVEAYEEGRAPYSDRNIQAVIDHFPPRPKLVVDISSGTGRSTRAIARPEWHTIGIEPNLASVHKARDIGGKDIEYRPGSVQDLPLETNSVDVATCFCGYHWWWHLPWAMKEMGRVLKKNAPFILVNKKDTGPFRNDLVRLLEPFCSKKIESPTYPYNAPAILAGHYGWRIASLEIWDEVDVFEEEQLWWQIQSMAPWSRVRPEQLSEALEVVKEHFRPQLVEGTLSRPLTVTLVAAYQK